MKGIKINVSNNIAQITERPQRIIAGTVGLPVEYTFDSHWDGLVKYAVFSAGKKLMMFEIENTATIPWEVLRKPEQQLMIGVYGEHPDGTEALPTVWANAGVIRHGAVPGTAPGIPSPPPVWENIKNSIGELDELNTEHKETLVGAINEVAGSKEVFVAEYGVTPIEDIVEAHNAGKAIVCKHGALLLPLVQRVGYNATFSGIDDLGKLHVIVNKNDAWSHNTEDMAKVSDTALVVNYGDACIEAIRDAHWNQNRAVWCKYNGLTLPMIRQDRNTAVFTGMSENEIHFVVNAHDEWTYTATEIVTDAKVKTLIEENATTPNWNASEGEPGYIENRPFYDEIGEGTVTRVFDGTSPLIDAEFCAMLFAKKEEATYIVDGKECVYMEVANQTDTLWSIQISGDGKSYFVFAQATGSNGIDSVRVMTTGGSMVPATISFQAEVMVPHKLDPKYLPMEEIMGGISGAKPMVYFELDVELIAESQSSNALRFNPQQIQTAMDNGMTIVIQTTQIASGTIYAYEDRHIMNREAMDSTTISGGVNYYAYSLRNSNSSIYINVNAEEIVQHARKIIPLYSSFVAAYAVSV